MVRAWKSWAKTGDHADPGPWLTRICVNHCITRSSALRLRRSRSAELDPALRAPAPTVSDPQLAGAYERLSRQQRAVVLLHY
jgi:DNA-directed RNA polymerase specialized sigma24 family protein